MFIVEGVHRGTRILQSAQAPWRMGLRVVLIFPIAICQLRTHAKHTRAPALALSEDAREGLGAGRGGGRLGRREGRERKGIHREGFVLSIAICQRRNPRHARLPLGDT